MDNLDWREPANDNFPRCGVCSNALPEQTGRGRKRKYCSDACLKAAFKMDPNGYVGDCNFCSAPMLGRKRKYCGDACRQEARKTPKKERAPKARKERVTIAGKCLECDIDFVGPPTKKFCGDRCSRKYNEARRDRYANAPERTCEHCGKTFKRKPNKKDAARFCSRQCGYDSGSNRPSTVPVVNKDLLAKARAFKVVCRIVRCKCDDCGVRFHAETINKKRCVDCARAHYVAVNDNGRDRTSRPCATCGVMFAPEYGDRRRKFCSAECNKKSDESKAIRKAAKYKRRTAVVEAVDPIKVFIRDGWKCRLCGVKTPRKLRGTYEPNAPELDHIIPIAAGGEHSYRNTQCACRKCNGAKGAKPLGQMLLFG